MKLIIWDFSRTLLFPKAADYIGGLNKLYDKNKVLGFNELFSINRELLDFIKSLKGKVKSVIFTSGNVQKVPGIAKQLKGLFVGIENVESVGYEKTNGKSYEALCEQYKVKPKDVLFIDDQEININAARRAGLEVFQYTDNKTIIEKVKEWIS